MGSDQTEPKIPKIELTKITLKPGTDSWVQICKQVRQALEEYSCVEVIYDKMPSKLHNTMYTSVADLFDLPVETKKQKTSDRPFHGYYGQYDSLPLYEALAIENSTTLEGAQHFTNVMWPQGHDGFCESMHLFAKLMEELNEMLMRMVFDSYGVSEKLCESQVAETSYLFRCFGYKTWHKDEKDLGFHSHTDLTVTTILHQLQVGGLQIKAKDGQWIHVIPSPSSFLFLAGDVLMAWSNDRIQSCEHRVIMKEENIRRYSLGLSSFSNGVTEVPQVLVDEDHPLRYKSFKLFEVLNSFQQKTNANFLRPIKTYCGISI